ncbi:hypothetical protein bcere0019_59160 [Bacillus cereus Rock3-28]|nr:hypothetical protein bcere0019_59160 [Bacillus cereus Rock3-28]
MYILELLDVYSIREKKAYGELIMGKRSIWKRLEKLHKKY